MPKVSIERKAEKFLYKIDEKRRVKILQLLKDLETNPLPFKLYDIVKLKGYRNHFRIRIGKIRIIYEVVGGDLIKIWDIDFRGRIY